MSTLYSTICTMVRDTVSSTDKEPSSAEKLLTQIVMKHLEYKFGNDQLKVIERILAPLSEEDRDAIAFGDYSSNRSLIDGPGISLDELAQVEEVLNMAHDLIYLPEVEIKI